MREDLKRRLMQLNGGSLAEEPPASEPVVLLEKGGKRARRSERPSSISGENSPLNGAIAFSTETGPISQEFLPLPDEVQPRLSVHLPGHVLDRGSEGRFYCVETLAHDFFPEWSDLGERFQNALMQRPSLRSASLARLRDFGPERLLFLDIETTGLGSCAVFLIGLMEMEGPGFRIRQLFARSYAEESAILRETAAALRRSAALVTFNGKTFDLPFIRNRMAHHRLPPCDEQDHIDLLYHARRQWKRRFPDCRLQTLEAHLCGRTRVGDVPSSQIPGVYRRFIRDGDPRPLKPVFSHNLIDLVTMAELLLALWEP